MSRLLQDLAGDSALARGDAPAVVMGDERLGYGELERLSDRLAAQLLAAGCRPGDRVALLMSKRPLALVAIQATLKAGCVYVPLDASSPAARLGRILGSAQPALLLAAPETAPLLDELAAGGELPPVWSIEAEAVAGERVRGERTRAGWDVDGGEPGVRVGPDDPAYLLFTSGSTGQPKGVVITHRNVVCFAEWFVRQFGSRPGERVSGHPPLHFDLSTLDLYTAFAAGAELHLVPPRLSLNPRALAAWIRDSELNRWVSVPSVLSYMTKFKAVDEDDFPALERVLWCGEVLPTPVLVDWMRRLPHVAFSNLYGPTEATVASSWYDVPALPADETEPVPIGRACEGEELLVLDEELRPAPDGESGELCIAGAGLSPGYWRDPERTEQAFRPDPRPGHEGERVYRTGDLGRRDESGLFHFLGRADSQIKSRGYRIELGEIESALGGIEGLHECAVVGVDGEGFEGVAICAAYVAEDDLEPPRLRRALAELLPSYMLPARWLALEELPKNLNGKVDRPALRERFQAQARERGTVRS
jgi:amino acid adenylation domain-containing protein